MLIQVICEIAAFYMALSLLTGAAYSLAATRFQRNRRVHRRLGWKT